jgi:acyl-CoA synthetase (AMP-forming)/AMP-acid ligase II
VVELLARTARCHPDQPSVVADGRTWSYAELYGAARGSAHGLQRAGIMPGDLVVLALPNGAEFLVLFFAALIAGAVAVPLFPGTASERLGSLAMLAGASALIVPASLRGESMRALASLRSRGAGPVVLAPGDLDGSGSPSAVPDDPDRPCYIQYTSGSTADPRGVVISHRNLVANIGQMAVAMDITSDDVFVSWLPTYHDMGLTLMALTPFSLGARLVLLPTDLRDVTGWLRAIEAHRGTFTAGPDFAYRLCLRNVPDPGRFDLSSLQVCMNAAEPVRAATLTGFETAFGLRDVMMTGYGLAEATLSVTSTPRGRAIDVDERGLVCLGQPMPGTTVRIIGAENMPLPAEQPGEIVVAGPSNCVGYHRNPAASATLILPDCSIRTGDLGYLDQAGRLYFTARRKDVIKVAGRTLYPQEVESLAEEASGVRLAAAVGVDRGAVEGEQLYVFAEARAAGTASASELQALVVEITRNIHEALGVRPRSTLLLRPRRIPMTANGKLRRAELREAYTTGSLHYGADIVFPPSATGSSGGRTPG